MPGRLTRFLNLERKRTAPEPPAHEVVTKARFAGTPDLILDHDSGEQPFLRCPSCEADNNRGAERCFNCQQPLQTDDARAWNAAYWEKRRHDESGAVAPGHPALVSRPLSDEERRLAEALAREVGERERARLFGWWGAAHDPTPIGIRFLRSIGDGSTRLLVSLGFAGAFMIAAMVAVLAPAHSWLRTGALSVDVLILSVFTPNLRARNSWWRW